MNSFSSTKPTKLICITLFLVFFLHFQPLTAAMDETPEDITTLLARGERGTLDEEEDIPPESDEFFEMFQSSDHPSCLLNHSFF